jgi:hypothetical protein
MIVWRRWGFARTPGASQFAVSMVPNCPVRALVVALCYSSAGASHLGKGTGSDMVGCTCAPPSPPFELGQGAAAAANHLPPPAPSNARWEEDQLLRCPHRDVQKMFLSAVAGALLALALTGRRPRRGSQAWTSMRESSAQTEEEPAAPTRTLPPMVEYLPAPSLQYLPAPALPPLRPLPLPVFYDAATTSMHRAVGVQTHPQQVTSDCQTDVQGAAPKVQCETQTQPAAECFAMGTQCLGIPHTDGFAQAVARTREATTQWVPADAEGAQGEQVQTDGYHLLLAEQFRAVGSRQGVGAAGGTPRGAEKPTGGASRDDGESAAGRRKAFTLDKMLQTEPHGVLGVGVQTDSLYARAASAQTAPLHPPIDEGSQTDRGS